MLDSRHVERWGSIDHVHFATPRSKCIVADDKLERRFYESVCHTLNKTQNDWLIEFFRDFFLFCWTVLVTASSRTTISKYLAHWVTQKMAILQMHEYRTTRTHIEQTQRSHTNNNTKDIRWKIKTKVIMPNRHLSKWHARIQRWPLADTQFKDNRRQLN